MSRNVIIPNLSYDTQRRLFYVVFHDGSDGHGHRRRHTRTFHTYAEAESALRKAKKASRPVILPHGVTPPENTCTLGEWLSWWLEEDVAVDRAASTVYAYRNMARCHILPALGAVRLRKLTAMEVQIYLYTQLNEGLSPNTVLKQYLMLFTALRKATMLEMIPANPMERVTPPKKEATRYTFYSPAQIRVLFRAVEGTMLELAVKLAAYLGLRRSEITGLRWDCVDFERDVIIIREVRTEVGGKDIVKAPKTATSVRRLGIGGLRDLRAVLLRAWERRRSDDPRELVLLRDDGTPPMANDLTWQMAQVVRQNGLSKITLHGLRHSFASVANSQGVPMFDISRTLGHSSIAITSNIYTHLFDETQTAALRTVAEAIDQTGKRRKK
jgi:integrase